MNLNSSTLLDTGLTQDPGCVPLVIGVAGHRDPKPEHLPVLKERCKQILIDIFNHLPNTPILMINGLAAGMDSVAAEIFIELINEQKSKFSNCPRHMMVGALPKPRNLYLAEDFPDNGDEDNRLTRMRTVKLLNQCDAVLDPDNCDELKKFQHIQTSQGNSSDSACYGRQGLFLVRNCYLLIAFSNGKDSGKIGGTSQTVALQRGQLSPLFLDIEEVMADRNPGIVVEIFTPRLSDHRENRPVGHARFWSEYSENDNNLGTNQRSLEKASLDDLLRHPEYPSTLNSINLALRHYPPVDSYGEGLQSSLWRYADSKANEHKQKYIRWCRLLMFTSVLLALGLSQPEWQSIGLLIVLAAIIIFPRLQEGPKLEFIQWRCLAESIKVTDHWAALQIQTDAANLFHSQTNKKFSRIRTIVRSRRLQLMSQQTNPSLKPPFPECIERTQIWISGQLKWLTKTISKQYSWDRVLLTISITSFILTLALSFGDRIGLISIHEMWTESGMAITAAFFGYRELLGYSDTNARYSRSKIHFQRAKDALKLIKEKTEDPGTINYRMRLIVEAIGHEKIDELNDWVGDQLQRVYSPGG